jgi:hypothetical protein
VPADHRGRLYARMCGDWVGKLMSIFDTVDATQLDICNIRPESRLCLCLRKPRPSFVRLVGFSVGSSQQPRATALILRRFRRSEKGTGIGEKPIRRR